MSPAEPHGSNDYQLDPIIDGLLERLPAPGDPFPKAERKLWLSIIEQVFDLVYPEETPGDPNEPQPSPREAI